MKLHTKHSTIERGGVQAETNFTIKTNALSFSILSSGLYTDPIMAIVRELSCNAYDAHVDADNASTPFEIHLPNKLEPFLSIKDFGTGLSDADIQGEIVTTKKADGTDIHTRTGGLYTTYFDSTKTQSNDFIGALGLGSKSPFSYSEAFEVISRHEGTKRTYAIFLNEDGIPTVALMGKIETDEHSGLEIKIAIKKEDFHTFASRTATALKFFKVQPTIKGAVNFEFDVIPKKRIESESWMMSSASGYYNSSIVAVQGNVQYRVDSAQIKEHLSDDLQTFISKANIVLFFTIGDLEVAANREEIRYDNQSVEAICAGVKLVFENMTKEIESRLGTLGDCFWDTCVDLNSLSDKLFNQYDFIRNHVKLDDVKTPQLKKYIIRNGQVNCNSKYGFEVYNYRLKRNYNSYGQCKRTTLASSFTPHQTTAVIINDVKTGGIKRMGAFLEESKDFGEAILITQRKVPHENIEFTTQELIPYPGFDVELQELKEELGNPKILLLSEITEAAVRSEVARDLPMYTYQGMYRKTYSYYNTISKMTWERETFNVADGGMYIPLKFGSKPALISKGALDEISFGDEKIMHDIILFLVSEYNKQNLTDYTHYDVYGLPASTYKKVSKEESWVNLFDFAYSVFPEYEEKITFYTRLQRSSDGFGFKEAITKTEFLDMVNGLPNNSTFKKALKPLLDSKTQYTTSDLSDMLVLTQLKSILGLKASKDAEPFFTDKTFNKYNMLKLVKDFDSYADWKSIKAYIKMVDRSK